jgi:serine/threonine-protein kinase RsbW
VDALLDTTSVKIPAKPEYVGVARLITAAFAGFLGFDSEAVEDIKIAVSEACTNAILQLHKDSLDGNQEVELGAYRQDDELVIDVKYIAKDTGAAAKPLAPSPDRDLGMDLLTSIMDKVEMIKVRDHEVILRLVKQIP